MNRILIVAMISVFMSGCGLIQNEASDILYVNGCMLELKDVSTTKAKEIVRQFNVDKDCKVTVGEDSDEDQK